MCRILRTWSANRRVQQTCRAGGLNERQDIRVTAWPADKDPSVLLGLSMIYPLRVPLGLRTK